MPRISKEKEAALSHEYLLQRLSYDPNPPGVFRWKTCSVRGNRFLGKEAGFAHNRGYLEIAINGKRYLSHRLAIFYVTGEWPDGFVDHIDGDRTNNAFNNLRTASNSENMHNRWYQKNSSTKLKGVYFDKRYQGTRYAWSSKIMVDGKSYLLGSYSTKEEAYAAYKGASKVLVGAFSKT